MPNVPAREGTWLHYVRDVLPPRKPRIRRRRNHAPQSDKPGMMLGARRFRQDEGEARQPQNRPRPELHRAVPRTFQNKAFIINLHCTTHSGFALVLYVIEFDVYIFQGCSQDTTIGTLLNLRRFTVDFRLFKISINVFKFYLVKLVQTLLMGSNYCIFTKPGFSILYKCQLNDSYCLNRNTLNQMLL